MDPLTLVLIALTAVTIGTVSIIGGMGGAVIMISILLLIFRLPIALISASVLLAVIIPASIGTVGAWRRREVDLKILAAFGGPVAAGVITGAALSPAVPEGILLATYSVVTLLLGALLILRSKGQDRWHAPLIRPVIRVNDHLVSVPLLISLGLIIGLISGMLGVGGGWAIVPVLIMLFDISPRVATGTSIQLVLINALLGGMTYLLAGATDIGLLAALATGLGIGALLGNILKPKLASRQITILLGCVLVLISMLVAATSLTAAVR